MTFKEFPKYFNIAQIICARIVDYSETLYFEEQGKEFLDRQKNDIESYLLEFGDLIIKAQSEIMENIYNSDGLRREGYEKYIRSRLDLIQKDIHSCFEINPNHESGEFLSIEHFEFNAEYRFKLYPFPTEREFIKMCFGVVEDSVEIIGSVIPFFPDFEPSTNNDNFIKIKWNSSPSLIGYLFLELTKQGYIELPANKNDGSYAALAKLVFKYFEINGKEGNPTTIENLIKEFNPNKNTIGISTSSKFTIPPFQKKIK